MKMRRMQSSERLPGCTLAGIPAHVTKTEARRWSVVRFAERLEAAGKMNDWHKHARMIVEMTQMIGTPSGWGAVPWTWRVLRRRQGTRRDLQQVEEPQQPRRDGVAAALRRATGGAEVHVLDGLQEEALPVVQCAGARVSPCVGGGAHTRSVAA